MSDEPLNQNHGAELGDYTDLEPDFDEQYRKAVENVREQFQENGIDLAKDRFHVYSDGENRVIQVE